MKDVVIVSGARTAIGTFGGSLAGVPPADLATTAIRAALERAALDPSAVEHVVLGNVIHTETRDMYISRVAALQAGMQESTPALTVNRLCGSGLQAIVSAAQHIMLGDIEVAIAGGAENMSRSPHATRSIRTGQRMGDVVFTDMMTGALSDPFGHGHMGITAENVARERAIGREAQDALALESHRRAERAQAEGYFDSQIVPVMVKVKREERPFAKDEHIRMGATMDGLAKLRPVFEKDGTVTAGNASGINDGAAAVTLMSAERARPRGPASSATRTRASPPRPWASGPSPR
jgi:acetyl-CoA C-acetyltransferase